MVATSEMLASQATIRMGRCLVKFLLLLFIIDIVLESGTHPYAVIISKIINAQSVCAAPVMSGVDEFT